MPSIPHGPHLQHGCDRSYQLPKNGGVAGPNTRKVVVLYHKRFLLSPEMVGRGGMGVIGSEATLRFLLDI